MPGALHGLRVLDMSRVLAGPFCCMMLGDHGADVIKVEPPDGDETRRYGPPFVDGESTYYLGINRNKRSIALDLATSQGQEIVRRLASTSDILVENFRTGAMARWGLDYQTLSALNPRLVYLSISGFGRSGPYANVAGYDGALQAFGGFMSINGEADGAPLKAGIAIADLATGLFASQGILLALHARQTTGVGQQVEASLLESMLAILHPHSSSYLNAGLVGAPHGNSHPMLAPYDLIPTADRPIFLPSGNDGQMRRLAEVIGRPELADDPRFRTNQDRVAHRRELLDILEAEFLKWPGDGAVPPVVGRCGAGWTGQFGRRGVRRSAGAVPRDAAADPASWPDERHRPAGGHPGEAVRHAGQRQSVPAAPGRAHRRDPRGAGLRRERGGKADWLGRCKSTDGAIRVKRRLSVNFELT